jgi:hypothetical protein
MEAEGDRAEHGKHREKGRSFCFIWKFSLSSQNVEAIRSGLSSGPVPPVRVVSIGISSGNNREKSSASFHIQMKCARAWDAGDRGRASLPVICESS